MSGPPATPSVANARMYSVTPEAAAAWAALFRHLTARTGIALHVVDHPPPAPIEALWERDDLLCAFMCGWPWVRGGARMQALAAPVPLAGGHEAGRPEYRSDIVVRRDSPARSLMDLGGATIGTTVPGSQSGFSALRHHLRTRPGPRFGAIAGPLVSPRRSIEAVAEGRADAAPIDSYAHALLRHHLPSLTDRVRILDRTAPTPIPLLVASPGADPAQVGALRDALLAVADPALLGPLCLSGFAVPHPLAAYAAMETAARDAEAAGIHDLTPFLDPVPPFPAPLN